MTKEGWKDLAPKQQWDIQVALRGPDCNDSEGLKWFTTAVIRGQMSKVMRVGGTINEDLNLIIVPQEWSSSSSLIFEPGLPAEVKQIIKAHVKLGLWNAHHFYEHVITAASHLGVPIGYVETLPWQKVALQHPAIAAKAYLTSLKTLGNGEGVIKELERHLKTQLSSKYGGGGEFA